MSSAGDNLDTLNDRQLRERCLYYGLQNVPITDTTRKLVINKLRACVSEHVKKSSLKNRLSTGQQMNEKKVEKISLKNRHNSAASKIVGTDVLKQLRQQADSPAPKRRSERKTIYSLVQPEGKSETKLNSLLEETNKDTIDDVVFVKERIKRSPSPSTTALPAPSSRQSPSTTTLPPPPLTRRSPSPPTRRSRSPSPSPIRPPQFSSIPELTSKQLRISRSPSLSKSVVVTTSYGKEQKPPSPIKEIEHQEDESLGASLDSEVDNFMGGNEQHVFNNVTTLHNPDIVYHHQFDDSYPTGYTPLYPIIKASPAKKFSVPDITRHTRNRGVPVKQTKSFGMQIRPHYLESDEDENIEAHAPYLSDFAKRLSRLRAEPIDLDNDNKIDLKPQSNIHKKMEKKTMRDVATSATETVKENDNNGLIVLRRREIFLTLFVICLIIILVTYYYPNKL